MSSGQPVDFLLFSLCVCVCVCARAWMMGWGWGGGLQFSGGPYGVCGVFRGEEQMRVGTNKKGEKRKTGSMHVAGVRSPHLPVSLCLHLNSLLSLRLPCLDVCVCVRVRLCVHSAKWNGRSCREYNRGPTEVARRHKPSRPLTL